MTINCPHCLQRARITSRNNMNRENTVVDLYCQCKNKECAVTFVMTLSFQNYLNPPVKITQQLAANLLNHLSKEERAALLQGMPPDR